MHAISRINYVSILLDVRNLVRYVLKYLMMLLDIKLLTLSFMYLGKVYESVLGSTKVDLAIIRHRLYDCDYSMTNFALYESPKIKGG